MVSVCLPSDALLQHLPSHLGSSYLGRGVSPHTAPPDLECGVALSALLRPRGRPFLILALLLPAAAPDLGRGVAPHGHASARSVANIKY